jgi:hypothetical protein
VKLLVAALAIALVLVSAATASLRGTGWKRWTVSHTGVSIELPQAWVSARAAGPRVVFLAWPRAPAFTGVGIALTRNSHYTTFEGMASDWVRSVRVALLKTDGKVNITTRRIQLPVGPAELITEMRIHNNVPVVQREYGLLHKGEVYIFSFECRKRDASRFEEIFAHAANSIRFTSNA